LTLQFTLLTELPGLLGILVILSALYMQGQSFVDPTIRAISFQSFTVAALFVVLYLQSGDIALVYLAAITAVIRGILIPGIMLYNVRNYKHSLRETGTGQRIPSFIIVGIILIIGGYAIFKSVLLPVINQLASVPFVLLLLSFLLIFTRRNALTQMAGFLEEENAVLYAGAIIAPSISLLVEFAIVLDVLGVVLVGVVLSASRDVFMTFEAPELEELTG
jgi:hydrogenase-4 component E